MTIPKLNLRDLFWLVVVVAMSLGWWTHISTQRLQISRLRSDLLDTTNKLNQSELSQANLEHFLRNGTRSVRIP
jgi:hypothetical protein